MAAKPEGVRAHYTNARASLARVVVLGNKCVVWFGSSPAALIRSTDEVVSQGSSLLAIRR